MVCRCISFFKGTFAGSMLVFESVDCHSPKDPFDIQTTCHFKANKHKPPIETPEFQCTKHHHAKHPMSEYDFGLPPHPGCQSQMKVHRNSLLTKNRIILVVTLSG